MRPRQLAWPTTIEQAFNPPHLSRPPIDPGPIEAFVSGPTGSRMAGVAGVFYPGW